MRALDRDLWVTETPLRFGGLELGARMTVVRLPDGDLVLHSPVRLDARLRREVQELGCVAHLVAPNKLHHLFLNDWLEAFPQSSLHLAPGLESKRPDLPRAIELAEEPPRAWGEVLEQVVMEGFPFANEVVFFHRPSRTLILTDLAANIGAEAAPLTRLLFRVMGVYGRLSPTLLERVLIRDRDAFRVGLERVLGWPFERVVVSHGAVQEIGGREELLRGYGWLLERSS